MYVSYWKRFITLPPGTNTPDFCRGEIHLVRLIHSTSSDYGDQPPTACHKMACDNDDIDDNRDMLPSIAWRKCHIGAAATHQNGQFGNFSPFRFRRF
jgi:hypothetical protein